MDILISCIGRSDPYCQDTKQNTIKGPLLTLIEERRFDAAYLFHISSVEMNQRVSKVMAAFKKQDENMRVEYCPFDAPDPTDLDVLFAGISARYAEIIKENARNVPVYWIQISSGTPQMQAIWMILAASDLVPAKMISLHPRYLENLSAPYSYEVKFNLARRIHDLRSDQTQSVIQSLQGEVRQLQLKVESLSSARPNQVESMDTDHLSPDFCITDYMRDLKRQLYAEAIRKYPKNASEAARMLGIPPHTFRMEAERMGLRPRKKTEK